MKQRDVFCSEEFLFAVPFAAGLRHSCASTHGQKHHGPESKVLGVGKVLTLIPVFAESSEGL